jgi:hypothetical protein
MLGLHFRGRHLIHGFNGWGGGTCAGADILFVDPNGKAADIGVTVSPVRIRTLEQFGDLGTVGDKLLAAERSKVVLVPQRDSSR